MRPRPCFRLALAAALLAALLPPPVQSQPAYMVADLQAEPTRDWSAFVFTPRIIENQGIGYFFHDDGIHGSELWRSDGTALGTYLLKDLCPGLCGGRTLTGPENAAALGSHLLFSGNDGIHGAELWITDGTAVGTAPVRDIWPGADSSSPSQMVTVGGQVFFTTDDGLHGRELWRSDGTAKGTYLVEDLLPGSGAADLPFLVAGGGHLYFTIYGASAEPGLWVSDGTAGGTQRLAALSLPATGPYKGRSLHFLPSGLLLFAAADSGSPDLELWRSDGTVLGTYRLKDLVPGPDSSNLSTFMGYGNELVFEAYAPGAGQVFWRSDGTEAGTTPIPVPIDFNPAADFGKHVTVGSHIFFAAWDDDEGLELWAFDGAAVYRVRDIYPGPESSIDPLADFDFNRAIFAEADGRLVFLADDGVHGFELWTSDGSEAGTERLSDLFPGTAAPEFDHLAQANPATALGERFVMRTFDVDYGYRLLASDGTAEGTGYLDTIGVASSSFLPRRSTGFPYGQSGSQCVEATARGLVFSTTSPEIGLDAVWGTDGTAVGTELLAPASLDSFNASGCTGLGGEALYFADHDGNPALWSTAGTLASTLLLADLSSVEPQPFGELRPYFVPFADGVAFGMAGGLWRSSGAAGTTALVSAIDQFSWGGLAATDDGRIAFAGFELYWSDGNPGGEVVTIDLNGVDPSYPRELTALDGGRLLFVAEAAGLGGELWISDGTAEATQLVREIRPGPRGYYEYSRGELSNAGPEPLFQSLGALAVFPADDGTTGAELWVTDGSFAGTQLLLDIVPGSYPSTPRHLTRQGDRVFFAAEDEAHGLELWVTDGTTAGTALVKDLTPGPASSMPNDLVVRDSVLYFSAWSPSYGREAWKSDGTTTGTIRISDVAPGPLSSSPQRFARAGNRLYFSATDQVHGYELWAISDDGAIPLFLDGFETSDALRWSEVMP